MHPLILVSICVAIPHLLIGLIGLTRPETLKQGLLKLPRHKGLYIALTAIDLGWLTYLTMTNTLPFPVLEKNKQLIFLIAPTLAWAIPRYLHELLGARALGGFLLLICVPVFQAGFLDPSLIKMVLTTSAYGWVLIGMILVIHPFRFHRCVNWLSATPGRWKLVNAAVLLYSLTLLALLLTTS